MDLHQEGRQLVEDIIRRKRIRMFLEGTPECEACLFPRPGTCLLLCRQGCRHYLCPGCAEETTQTERVRLEHHLEPP
jgi:hypothetical protein